MQPIVYNISKNQDEVSDKNIFLGGKQGIILLKTEEGETLELVFPPDSNFFINFIGLNFNFLNETGRIRSLNSFCPKCGVETKFNCKYIKPL